MLQNSCETISEYYLYTFQKNRKGLSPVAFSQKIIRNFGSDKINETKILKLNKILPCKMQLAQDLGDDNFNRRVKFCETMILPNFCGSYGNCFF